MEIFGGRALRHRTLSLTPGPWSELLQAPFRSWREVLAAHEGPAEDWRTASGLGGLPVPSHDLHDDTALALFLSGETKPRGPHLENLVLMDLLAWRDVQARRPEVLYWRTASGSYRSICWLASTAYRTAKGPRLAMLSITVD